MTLFWKSPRSSAGFIRPPGPALLFRNAKGTAFPILGNLFGTLDRTKYLFRDALESVRMLVELKVDPGRLAKNPWRYRRLAGPLWRLLPGEARAGPILANQTTLDQLPADPMLAEWTADRSSRLPLVYTEDPNRPGPARSNLGMYRVQLAGNEYVPNREAGCTIRSTAASACITPPRSRAANPSGSTSSSAGRRP